MLEKQECVAQYGKLLVKGSENSDSLGYDITAQSQQTGARILKSDSSRTDVS